MASERMLRQGEAFWVENAPSLALNHVATGLDVWTHLDDQMCMRSFWGIIFNIFFQRGDGQCNSLFFSGVRNSDFDATKSD
ncbi:hypothetical protein Golax_010992, partial [Gossypium laxum]|nr:hypothetical protein [Gossypium laxum]